ncbi:MAG: exodeoxyribonuclease VII small subunit [Clostridia bacterium]|nr:exodeoxyribonuclease VII small subunit [Clostridia bacterium]
MKAMTFEEKMQKVEAIAQALEGENLGLEDSMKQYEAGMKLLQSLEDELSKAKQRLTVIRETPNGPKEEVWDGLQLHASDDMKSSAISEVLPF